jgi:hypothetical protein
VAAGRQPHLTPINQPRPLPHSQDRIECLRTALRDPPAEGYLLGPPGGAIRGRVLKLVPGVPVHLPRRFDAGGDAAAAGGGGRVGVAAPGLSSGEWDDMMVMSRRGTTREDIQAMYDRTLNAAVGGWGWREGVGGPWGW